jgi:hypothetical protein
MNQRDVDSLLERPAQISDELRELRAVAVAARRLLNAWDIKPPLSWQPENNWNLLEELRMALYPIVATHKEGNK